MSDLRWFDDSPDVGDPSCLCSYCGERIEEEEDEFGNAAHGLRMTDTETNREMRFHDQCVTEAYERGLLSIGDKSE